jgi:hypothetical protein
LTVVMNKGVGRLVSDGKCLRLWVGVIGGLASWLILGATGLGMLRAVWTDYALAEPNKAYTFGMLLSRLTVGLISSVTAGAVAAKVARGSTNAAWWLGGLLLVFSAPIHLVRVWADYPAWYHVAWLLPLMPITGSGGALVRATPTTSGSDSAGA